MINGLISGSSGHINVIGGTYSTPYISPNAPSAGMVRYLNNNFEVYNGSSWQVLSGAYPTIDLTGAANSAINWVIKKMAEDAELENLAKSHPAVKAAYDSMLRSVEQLKTTIILSKDDKTTN
jgi:hypothetical protein